MRLKTLLILFSFINVKKKISSIVTLHICIQCSSGKYSPAFSFPSPLPSPSLLFQSLPFLFIYLFFCFVLLLFCCCLFNKYKRNSVILSLWVWLIPHNMMISSPVHLLAICIIPFLRLNSALRCTQAHACVCAFHIFFMHLSVDGHPG